jgi:hypothetical protein
LLNVFMQNDAVPSAVVTNALIPNDFILSVSTQNDAILSVMVMNAHTTNAVALSVIRRKVALVNVMLSFQISIIQIKILQFIFPISQRLYRP